MECVPGIRVVTARVVAPLARATGDPTVTTTDAEVVVTEAAKLVSPG